MARLPRYVIPGQPQHIIQRGNNRQPIFAADADYQFFRDALIEAAEKHGLAIHAYAWMTNHIHLLATPEFKKNKGTQKNKGTLPLLTSILPRSPPLRRRFGKGGMGKFSMMGRE